MNNQIFLKAMGNIRDEYILDAISHDHGRKRKIAVFARIAAACLFIIVAAGISVNTIVPTYARNLPFVGSVFAYIQDKLHVTGGYSNYADEIGDVVVDNGLSVTLSEAYCDGVNLFVSYVVESEVPFSSLSTDSYAEGQLDYDVDVSIECKDVEKKLDDFGVQGIEGEFTDDFTFVGIDTFSLTGEEFPDEFMLNIKIDSVGLITQSMDSKVIKGDWNFSVPIDRNAAEVVTYEINKEQDGHSIDKIVVTPIFTTIYTSYPDIYSGTVNYRVRTYTDEHADEDISSQGQYGATSGITQIPTSRINHELHIYVLDASRMNESEFEHGTQAESKEYAIVSLDFTLE